MLKAILFDFDGTIANTEPLHYKTWKETLKDYGVETDPKFYKQHISGRTNPAIIQNLLPQLSPTEAEKVANEKEAKFREMAVSLQPLTGLLDFIKWIKYNKLQKAIVTNSPPENAKFLLGFLSLKDTFPLLISGAVMPEGKPDPAPYKLCLEKLKISPEEAIVFEDSPSGIQSAVGAGICTIGVASTHERGALVEAGAKISIKDFSDEQLNKIFPSWKISDMNYLKYSA